MSDQRGFVVWLLLGIGLLLGLGLWVVMQPSSKWGSEYFDYGEPTPLAGGAPLREAFCAIRADFDTLPDREGAVDELRDRFARELLALCE